MNITVIGFSACSRESGNPSSHPMKKFIKFIRFIKSKSKQIILHCDTYFKGIA